MKNILFISYYFPPAGGSAVQRTLKFVKYLPEFGWKPFVLSADPTQFVIKDESLLEEVPRNIKIKRTFLINFYSIYNWIIKGSGKSSADLSALFDSKGGSSWKFHIALFIRSNFFIPDAHIGWLPWLVYNAYKIIKNNKIDLIFVSAPPFTSFVAGAILSEISGLPLVIDYHDPWTGAYFYFKRSKISDKFERFIEKTCLRKANKIISINKQLIELINKNYGYNVRGFMEKADIIPNGFDPADFEKIDTIKNSSNFTIVYTGTQHSRMNSLAFVKVIEKIAEEDTIFRKYIKLIFIGRISKDVVFALKNSSISDNIEIVDHIDHKEVLRHTTGADILLLLIPLVKDNELIVTGKIFEYLRSGNPIFCLSSKGDAPDIIRRAGAGFTVSPNNFDEMKKIIIKCFELWRNGKPILNKPVDMNVVEEYNRKKLTGKLANILTSTLINSQTII